jgi:hypothetical protein
MEYIPQNKRGSMVRVSMAANTEMAILWNI